MKKNIIPYLIKRYLRYDKTQPFITITALLAFFGVSVGVMVLIVTMAIMNGTKKEFESKLFTMNYPLTIYPKYVNFVNADLELLINEKMPKLKLSPFVQTQAIVKNGDVMNGGLIFGVDFQKERAINDVLEKALGDKEINKYDIVLGEGTVKELNLIKDEKAVVVFTNLEPNGFANAPKMKRFKYIEYFHSGLIAYDKTYMYTTIDSLQTIYNRNDSQYDGIHIYSKNPQEDIIKLKEFLPSYVGVIGWWQQNGNFFSALEMEKRALFIILLLIIIVASLNIISSLLMTVMSRRKEIALLLSLGATKKEVKNSFFYLGAIIGGSGVIFGLGLGFLGIYLLSTFDIINRPADVYGTTHLPVDLAMLDLLYTILGSFVIIVVSSYYPAKKAAEIDVLSVLRYE